MPLFCSSVTSSGLNVPPIGIVEFLPRTRVIAFLKFIVPKIVPFSSVTVKLNELSVIGVSNGLVKFIESPKVPSVGLEMKIIIKSWCYIGHIAEIRQYSLQGLAVSRHSVINLWGNY